MEGKNTNIPIKGIVRNTPGAICPDGEMEDMLNLRYKDGAFRPIPEIATLLDGLNYTNIYIHSNAGYKHYLGVRDNTFFYFASELEGVITRLTELPLCSLVGAAAFTQIGNVINILDSSGLKYAVWYDKEYKLIDTNFDGGQTDTSIGVAGNVTLKVDNLSINDFTTAITAKEFYNGTEANTNGEDEIIAEIVKARGIHKAEGNLHGFILACTAVELYDGSYILHSTPVLLGQAADATTRYNQLIAGTNYSYTDALPVVYRVRGVETDKPEYKVFEAPTTFIEHHTSSGEITVPTSGVPSILVTYFNNYTTGSPMAYNSSSKIHVLLPSNILKYKIHQSIPNELKALVKSVSVFITKEIDCYDFKTRIASHRAGSMRIGSTAEDREWRTDFGWAYRFESIKIKDWHKSDADIAKEILAEQTFYKVYEIPFDEIKTTVDNDGWLPIDLKGKLGDNLGTMEVLPLDPFSHHSLLPEVGFVYNSKLHIADYKSVLSHGWPLSYFHATQGLGQFAPSTRQYIYFNLGAETAYLATWSKGLVKVGDVINYGGNRTVLTVNSVTGDFTTTPAMPAGAGGTAVSYLVSESEFSYVEVKIKTADGMTSVVRHSSSYIGVSDLNPILSYPDTRATEMTVYVKYANAYKKQTFKLTASDTNNFAYYLNPDLKPIPFVPYNPNPVEVTPPEESNREQIYRNGMKVSAVNNPFTFPLESTYTVGNTRIIGLMSNTIALSTGQFGEFPLYVFCSDGIWGMYLGGASVTYSSSKPISREVCNNPLSIKAVDSGVVFTTAKGVMILSGAQVQEISVPVEGKPFDFATVGGADYIQTMRERVTHNALVSVLSEMSTFGFLEYVAGAIVGYNYIEREIWFVNPLMTYAYIYSRGVWYKVKATGSSFVNDYPKQYLLKGTDLLDISSEKGTSVPTIFLSRPIKIGTQGFKQAMRAALRGILNTVNATKDVTVYRQEPVYNQVPKYKDVPKYIQVPKYKQVPKYIYEPVYQETPIYGWVTSPDTPALGTSTIIDQSGAKKEIVGYIFNDTDSGYEQAKVDAIICLHYSGLESYAYAENLVTDQSWSDPHKDWDIINIEQLTKSIEGLKIAIRYWTKKNDPEDTVGTIFWYHNDAIELLENSNLASPAGIMLVRKETIGTRTYGVVRYEQVLDIIGNPIIIRYNQIPNGYDTVLDGYDTVQDGFETVPDGFDLVFDHNADVFDHIDYGVLDYVRYAGIYVFGSYDCAKWAFLGGTEKTGAIRDIGTTIERVDCKYFRIGFVGELEYNSTLDFIEMSAKGTLSGKIR